MTERLHLAAQYPAAAGISFLRKEEDDSHTNLGFDPATGRMSSRTLGGNEVHLALNYSDFSLEWISSSGTKKLPLHQQKHSEILEWIAARAKAADLDGDYRYALHYTLPYALDRDYVFQLEDAEKLAALKQTRSLAQQVIEAIVWDYSLDSEVRIWPHHFDTGAYGTLPERPALSIGLGLAIPDSLIDDYYYYAAAYQGRNPLPTTSFDPLSEGKWLNEGFVGAVLPLDQSDRETALNFFAEAIQAFSTC